MTILQVHTTYNGTFINSRTINIPHKTRKGILNRFMRDAINGKVWNHTITHNPVGTCEVTFIDDNTIEVEICDEVYISDLENNDGIFQRALNQFQDLFMNNS